MTILEMLVIILASNLTSFQELFGSSQTDKALQRCHSLVPQRPVSSGPTETAVKTPCNVMEAIGEAPTRWRAAAVHDIRWPCSDSPSSTCRRSSESSTPLLARRPSCCRRAAKDHAADHDVDLDWHVLKLHQRGCCALAAAESHRPQGRLVERGRSGGRSDESAIED